MLKPAYALVGTDLFLQLAAIGELIGGAPEGIQRIDLEGETASLADVLDELRSFSMFSSAKLVVIRSAGDLVSRFREQLEHYIAKPSSSATLVLRLDSLPSNQRIYKQIASVGQIINCNPPKDPSRWIVDRAQRAHNLVMPPEAARVLADLIGDDLGRLDNELAKLALQTDGRVDVDAVSGSVAFQREQEMWDMTNQLAAGNITEALRRWRQLVQLDSSAEFRAVTWLVMWLERVRKAIQLRRAGKRDFDISRELKIWPASAVAPFLKTADRIGESGTRRLLDLLADIDHRSKSGLGEMDSNVERFLLSVSVPS